MKVRATAIAMPWVTSQPPLLKVMQITCGAYNNNRIGGAGLQTGWLGSISRPRGERSYWHLQVKKLRFGRRVRGMKERVPGDGAVGCFCVGQWQGE